MRRPRRSSAAIATALALMTACGGASSGGPGTTRPANPFNLDGSRLPDDRAQIDALLGRMPADIDGRHRRPAQGEDAVWSSPGRGTITLTIASLAQAGGPGITMTRFFSRFAAGGTISAKEAHLDGSGDLLYLVGPTRGGASPGSGAAWARPTGSWLFGVESDDEAGRDALTSAFAAAERN